MPSRLTITPTPFKSSNLAIPPSPFTPRTPLHPLRQAITISLPRSNDSKPAAPFPAPPPPSDPLRWLWQCHLCSRVYQLGVTRRCLDDGHHFCAGTTTVQRSRRTNKKVVRHKACASEFDYQGWKAWGTWRRQVQAARALVEDAGSGDTTDLAGPGVPTAGRWMNGAWDRTGTCATKAPGFRGKDCWATCDYPSECRWGKAYGVQSPVVPATTAVPEKKAKVERPATPTFDDILIDATDPADSTAEHMDHPAAIKDDWIAAPVSAAMEDAVDAKKPSLDDMLDSVKRRKRKSDGQMPSPLGATQPSPTVSEVSADVRPAQEAQTTRAGEPATTSYLQRAFDDFELDVKKSLEKAGDIVVGWTKGATAVKEEPVAVPEVVAKALRIGRKK